MMGRIEQLQREMRQIRETYLDKRREQLDIKDKSSDQWHDLEAECLSLMQDHYTKSLESKSLDK
ncbi:hypothetical protein [Pontibacter mangrovi]|uniref:Uncharacterized protein n=1 Tax=Pontibacter mangrovi TaxID=2589816 RepID=A0A501WAW4_9BACT|nr:hypothetical protein [Pontibacter mangrovi]TPE43947.1 hypothetical protein FJM65_11015 [Pontibacter mangrovi]